MTTNQTVAKLESSCPYTRLTVRCLVCVKRSEKVLEDFARVETGDVEGKLGVVEKAFVEAGIDLEKEIRGHHQESRGWMKYGRGRKVSKGR